MLTKNNQKLD